MCLQLYSLFDTGKSSFISVKSSVAPKLIIGDTVVSWARIQFMSQLY